MDISKVKPGQSISQEEYRQLIAKQAKPGRQVSNRTQLKEVPKSGKMALDSYNDVAIIDKPSRHSKFNAKVVWVDGIRFDSTWEGKRYSQLKLLERTGDISDLRLQIEYPLECNGVHICKYIADFVYNRGGIEIVEDAKGFITPEYRIKRKLMQAIHGIDILETRAKSSKKK